MIHKVDGDGNCLFNAIAYGILYRETMPRKPTKKAIKMLSKILREKMIIRMYKRILGTDKDKINDIMAMAGTYDEEYDKNSTNFKHLNNNNALLLKSIKYIEKMSIDKCWGGMIELKFLNDIIKKDYDFRGIVVYDIETEKPFIGMEQILYKTKRKPILSIVHYEGTHYDYLEINKYSSVVKL